MKHTRASSCIAALLLAASAFHPSARAANARPADVLLSGPWKISGNGGYLLTFSKDGTFTTDNLLDQPGHWKLTKDALTLTFGDGHSDIFALPLNPQGTAGNDRGQPVTASLAGASAAIAPAFPPRPVPAPLATPPPAPAPAAATPAKVRMAIGTLAPAPPGAPTVAMLATDAWKLSKNGRSDIRIFNMDGTFTTPGSPDENGKWSMTKDFIILIYPSGHKDALTLPLDPRGTSGYADNGDAITAVMVDRPLAGATAAATPVGVQSDIRLPGAQPAGTPMYNPAPQAPALSPREIAAATTLLVSAPWKMTGARWFAVRTFARDGTFTTTAQPKEQGAWSISGNTVNLVFEDGHTDTLALPLDPAGTSGVATGKPAGSFTAVLQTAAAQSTPAPGSMDALLHPQAAPHGLSSADKARIAGVLIAAPWKITGATWSSVRIFAEDGTFTTIGRPKEFGNWSISDKSILLIYQDKHIDTLTLPLDAKSTDGTDRKGAPVNAVQQAPDPGGGLPTPAPTAAPATIVTRPAPVPKGNTPPPYGTDNPGGATPVQQAPANPFGTSNPF